MTLARPKSAIQGESQKLMDLLLEQKLISKDQFEIGKKQQKITHKPLEKCLIDLGFITEDILAEITAQVSGYSRVNLRQTVLDIENINKLPHGVAKRFCIIPIDIDNGKLKLAMADVYNILAFESVKSCIPEIKEIIPQVALEQEILEAIDIYYGYEMSIQGLLREIETGDASGTDAAITNPNIRLVNAFITDAIKQKASDIHFEPEGQFVRIRFRIDGLLKQIMTLHSMFWSAICVRIKIMAEMNIAETRRPQNGRFHFYFGTREIDLRVASHPTIHGENIVIRILDKTRSLLPLENLGYSKNMMPDIKRCLDKSQGIIIITGPTGCGKTTSLYSMLNYISHLEVNIMTLEEPVEYQLPLIRQTQIKSSVGMGFAEGIRSILRQDPDIILIGEIRDSETAQMALRASMTGHLVFTILHTNDALSALERLSELGLPLSMVMNNLLAVIAQRLVRILCLHCKTPVLHRKSNQQIFVSRGCDHCNKTGYKGRKAVAEILMIDKELKEYLHNHVSPFQIKKILKRKGFRSFVQDLQERIFNGETSMEEARRVIGDSGDELIQI